MDITNDSENCFHISAMSYKLKSNEMFQQKAELWRNGFYSNSLSSISTKQRGKSIPGRRSLELAHGKEHSNLHQKPERSGPKKHLSDQRDLFFMKNLRPDRSQMEDMFKFSEMNTEVSKIGSSPKYLIAKLIVLNIYISLCLLYF